MRAIAYILSRANSWAHTRGAQLTAGYTVNTYSKPPVYYTLGAVAPLLPCVSCRAYARPCYARHTHSGLAALCRTRTDRHSTCDRHDLPPTNQPTNQPTSQPFRQYPVVSWEKHKMKIYKVMRGLKSENTHAKLSARLLYNISKYCNNAS